MDILNNFIELLVGHFDNSEQFNSLKEQNINDFPFAEHIHHTCNHMIENLPEDFKGIFMLQESYYTLKGRTKPLPHFFLFTEKNGEVKLDSYELPEGYTKDNLKFENLKKLNYTDLKIMKKFNPAIYKKIDGVWEGGSISMFTPELQFTIVQRFCEDFLEVSETMELNGKRTLGFDYPIIYKRVKK